MKLEQAGVQQSPRAQLTVDDEFQHQFSLARTQEPSAAAAAFKPQPRDSAELGPELRLHFTSRPSQFFPSHSITLNLQSQTSQSRC